MSAAGGAWLIRGARLLGGGPSGIGVRDGLVAGLGPDAATEAGPAGAGAGRHRA